MTTILALALHGADNDRPYQRVQEELRVHDALCTAGYDSLFLHTLVPKSHRNPASRRAETVAYDPVPMLPGYAVVRTGVASDAWLSELLSVTYRVGRRRARAIEHCLGAIHPDDVGPLLAVSGRVAKAPAIYGFKVGDRVRIVGGAMADTSAVVESVKGKRAEIISGDKRLIIATEKLRAA